MWFVVLLSVVVVLSIVGVSLDERQKRKQRERAERLESLRWWTCRCGATWHVHVKTCYLCQFSR